MFSNDSPIGMFLDRLGNDVIRYVAAGIIRVIKEITIFLNATDASYSRFGNSTAPDKAIPVRDNSNNKIGT